MNRFLRTLRQLDPAQVLHRVRLRARRGVARTFPRLSALRARRAAGPVPRTASLPAIPGELLRPCEKDRIRSVADEVSMGRFSFLGVSRDLGANPFPAPAEASLLWAYQLEYMEYLLDLALAGDLDRIDELCRARRSAEGISHPAMQHPYPESRRITTWIQILDRALPRTRPLILESVWVWANRLLANLEVDVGGNHLLENGLALSLAGSLFRGRRAAVLRHRGRAILLAGARNQVLSDGCHYELSPTYHARVLWVLLAGGWILEARGEAIPPGYWSTLASMAEFLEGILDFRGELPLIGDTVRDPALRPMRLLDAVWTMLPLPRPSVPRGDRRFKGSGIFVFEDASRGHRLLLDAGPVCPGNLPAHGQADTFTFLLHAGGRAFVVDAGLFEYRKGAMRDWCRSTRAHSTVEVDGENSSEVYGSFRVGRRARVVESQWFLDGGRGTFFGRHDGYRHLGAMHSRMVSHLAEGLWLVADKVTGRGHHSVVSRLHLHPEVAAEERPGGAIGFCRAGRSLVLVPFGAGRLFFEDAWTCPAFGERRPSRILGIEPAGAHSAFGYVLSAGSRQDVTVSREADRIHLRRGSEKWVRRLP